MHDWTPTPNNCLYSAVYTRRNANSPCPDLLRQERFNQNLQSHEAVFGLNEPGRKPQRQLPKLLITCTITYRLLLIQCSQKNTNK